MASRTTTLFEGINKDFLTCSICKQIFTHPKQLRCMHSFCQDCLKPLVKHGAPNQIRCPLCREKYKLLVDSVTELEDNTFISNLCEIFRVAHLNAADVLCSFCSGVLDEETASRCIECSDDLCEKCSKTHTLTRVTRNHQVVLMSELETATLIKEKREENNRIPCQKHPNNYLDYFCQKCQVPVCLGCTIVDHTSKNGHQLKNLQDNTTKSAIKSEITQQVHKLDEMIPSFKKHIALANDAEKCLFESLEKTKNDIRATSKSFIDKIEVHTKAMIKKVDKRAEAIHKMLDNHREAAEIRVKSSTGINEFAKNICKHGLTPELMLSTKDLRRRMKELQEDMDDPNSTGELRFVKQTEFRFGRVEEYKECNFSSLLEYYTQKEMAIGDSVKMGPISRQKQQSDYYDDNELGGCDDLEYTIKSIQRKEPNMTIVTISQCHEGYSDYDPEPEAINIELGEYWLQPTNPSESYSKLLDVYVKHVMKIGDEVRRGPHWPGGYGDCDDNGQQTGTITRINRGPTRTAVKVQFHVSRYGQVMDCSMYPGNYMILPLKPIQSADWVNIESS